MTYGGNARSPKPRIWKYMGVYHCAVITRDRQPLYPVAMGFSPWVAYNDWWDVVWPSNFPRAVAPQRFARGYAHVKPE